MEPQTVPQQKVKVVRKTKKTKQQSLSQKVVSELDKLKVSIPKDDLSSFDEIKGVINGLIKEQEDKPLAPLVPKKKKSSEQTVLGKAKQCTPKLRKFMGYDENQTCSYLLLNKKVCAYVKDNNLQYEDRKSFFRLDNVLKELLGVDKDELGYTTIMPYYAPLFKQSLYPINQAIVTFAEKAGVKGWKVGDEQSVYTVQRMVEQYFDKNNMYEPGENGVKVPKTKRRIVLDDATRTLFNLNVIGYTDISQTQFERYIKILMGVDKK